jgi:hypothetical protein
MGKLEFGGLVFTLLDQNKFVFNCSMAPTPLGIRILNLCTGLKVSLCCPSDLIFLQVLGKGFSFKQIFVLPQNLSCTPGRCYRACKFL